MNITQQCYQLQEKMMTSPLRTQHELIELTQFNVDEHPDRLAKIIENIQQTLKVFVIGEVKAGKSSLINTLVGQDISPTNILEATASLWEIGYASQNSASIEYLDGQSESIPFEKVQSVLSISNEENLKKAKEIACIRVRTEKHDFRELLLIDSPGLATITEQNAQLTRSILQDVDIALWVLNSNHLGQTDIMQEVDALARLGKPIIAVISKIDEADTEPNRLIRYVSRHAGEYFQEIFALSVHAYKNGGEYAEYFDDFRQYLKEQVSLKAVDVKLDSVKSSLDALTINEKTVHESIVRQIRFKLHEVENFQQDLEFEKEMLVNDVNSSIEHKISALLEDAELEHQLKNILLRKDSSETVTSRIKDTVSNPFNTIHKMDESVLEQITNRYMHQVHEQTHPIYISALKRLISKVQQQSQQRFDSFREQELFVLQKSLAVFDDVNPNIYRDSVDVIDMTIKGGIFAGVAGTAAAGYTAVLGAHAATVTMGAAMGAVALPVTIAGVVLAGGYAYFQKGKNEAKLALEISRIRQQIMDSIRSDLLKTYHEQIESDMQNILQQYCTQTLNDYTVDSLRDKMFAIENYVNNLY